MIVFHGWIQDFFNGRIEAPTLCVDGVVGLPPSKKEYEVELDPTAMSPCLTLLVMRPGFVHIQAATMDRATLVARDEWVRKHVYKKDKLTDEQLALQKVVWAATRRGESSHRLDLTTVIGVYIGEA